MPPNRPSPRETATLANGLFKTGQQGLRFASRITLRVMLFLFLASSALSLASMAFIASAHRVKGLPHDPRVAGAICLVPFLPPLWALIKPAGVSIWIGIFTLLPPFLAGIRFHDSEALSHLAILVAPWYAWAVIQLRAMWQAGRGGMKEDLRGGGHGG